MQVIQLSGSASDRQTSAEGAQQAEGVCTHSAGRSREKAEGGAENCESCVALLSALFVFLFNPCNQYEEQCTGVCWSVPLSSVLVQLFFRSSVPSGKDLRPGHHLTFCLIVDGWGWE